MFWCLTRFFRSIVNLLYTEQTHYSCKLKRLGSKMEPLKWTVTIPENTILCETVSKLYLGEITSKTKVWYSDEVFIRESEEERFDRLDQKPECPWIWIGCGETDYSKELSQYVVHGNLITKELLAELFEETEWSYICSKTLDKKDFPLHGIEIS